MRNSERIRELELTVVALQYELEFLKATLEVILENENAKSNDLDAGKWYSRRLRDQNE